MAGTTSHHVAGRISPGQDRHQFVGRSVPGLQQFLRVVRGRHRHRPCLLFDEAVDWTAVGSNERGSQAVKRTLLGLVMFAAVGVVLGGCTGGGGGDSAPPAAQAPDAMASVTFQWDPVAVPDLAGYKLYRSTTSGTYGSPIATLSASTTTYQMTNLTKGVTYFFAVSAYDTNGNESPFSNEQSRTIP